MSEASRVAMLRRIFGGHGDRVETGIGDDAAVLEMAVASKDGSRLVWTIDEQVEGTHFRLDLASWHDVGWRSFMSAASDLAAMGASPWCALSALVAPDHVDDVAFDQIARGQRAAADVIGASIVGGNLARGPALSIATTLLGTCNRAVLRSGARPGHGLWLSGRVGHAAAGLLALEAGRGHDAAFRVGVDAWRRPMALLTAGRDMARVALAAIDVSDGLVRDVGHIADASCVRVVIDEAAIVDAELSPAAAALSIDALDLALYGGEDYAIVAASPVAIDGFRRIGAVVEGRGVAILGPSGERLLEPRGYDHFTSDKPPAASRS